jgi:nicotinamide riboside transporter PnuC
MNLTLPDFLGHIGYANLTLGMILIARKNIWGWLFRAIGEVIWVVVGLMLGLSSAWMWGTIFLFIEAYGFWKWRKEAKKAM